MDNFYPVTKSRSLPPEKVEQAWTRLVECKTIDHSSLRPQIASSWEYCLERNVDLFSNNPNFNIAKSEEIIATNSLLVDVAARHLLQLYDILKGKGYCLFLVSADGYILHIFGDKDMVNHAEKANVIPGGNDNEHARGTTAVGISMTQGVPIQVFHQEHYCQVYHDFCCSAAPIRSPENSLRGVINVANRDPSRHPVQVLNLVAMTANAIESEMNYRIVSGDYDKAKHRLSSIVECSAEPTLVFDDRDLLIHCNHQARRLLGTHPGEFIGSSATDLIANYQLVKGGLLEDRQWAELRFSSILRNQKMEAQLKKLASRGTSPVGTLVILKERTKSVARSQNSLGLRYSFRNVIHRSREMVSLIEEAKTMAVTDHGLLLEGESGTGKEVLAQAIHNESSRRDRPFIAVNCAALPRDLVQSELFGYEPGAFTGAKRDGQIGKFEQANHGTIFLDEIGDMPLEAQVNLLRVLQEKVVVPVGGMTPRPIDVRVIAATNKELLAEVEAGRFRGDLYYRLSVMSLRLPPLRERPSDLWELIAHFIERHAAGEHMAESLVFERGAKTALENYSWPGNIRELENAVIFMLTKLRKNSIGVNELPPHIARQAAVPDVKIDRLMSVECDAIRNALSRCGGNLSKTAKTLGIGRATLYRKIEKYNLK